MGDESTGSIAVSIAPGVDVRCEMGALDGSVDLGIEHEGKLVEKARIGPATPPKPFTLDLGAVEIDVALGADNELGVVTAKGAIRLDDPFSEKGTKLAEIDKPLFLYAPAHGSVGNHHDPDPPIFDDPKFGKTRMSSKNVTRVFVDDRERMLADVGRVVKSVLWDDYPDWTFNTVACVGDFDGDGRGTYSDPSSIWFNVFLGYYQIDAPKKDWDRPFAYESADGAKSKVRYDEIARLGKTDWNYISNWMYGVPGEIVSGHNEIDLKKLRTSQEDGGRVGSSRWHRVRIGGVEFVSAYEADTPGADRLTDNSLISGLWRKAFGIPNPRREFTRSFIPTLIDADMYMAYWEDDEAFHTVIFGGTAPTGTDPAFLGRQMTEAEKVIERAYPDLGFEARH